MRIALRRNFFKVGAFLAILVGLSVVEVGQVVFSPGIDHPNYANRPLLLMFWGCFASWLSAGLLLPFVRHLSRRYLLHGAHWWLNASIHVCASLLFSIAYLIGGYFIRAIFYNDSSFGVHIPYLINNYYVYGVIFYWAALGYFLAVDFYVQARSFSLAASRLETSLTQAQLESLRSRLNPHFLFNALGSISALALAGEKEQVVELMGRLSHLLRRSLDDLSDIEVPLSTELDFLNDYIAIQLLRFPTRLTFEPAISPETMQAFVPSMLLQPLIENAVEHGIAASSAQGRVTLIARREGDLLHMEICDTGPGFTHSGRAHHRRGFGLGLESTRQRLEYLYGSDHRLECLDLPEGGARILVSIPFHAEPVLKIAV